MGVTPPYGSTISGGESLGSYCFATIPQASFFCFKSLSALNVEETMYPSQIFFPHSFKKSCFPAESLLDKLNFSRSDKLNFPNSDVHTENCLILLLQHVSSAA